MSNFKKLCGWIPPEQKEHGKILSSLPIPTFSDAYQLKGTGRGKKLLLTELYKKLTGTYQFRVQAIGDCVSFGLAYAIDHTYAADILFRKENEIWVGDTSTEDLYGGSRVQIGGSRYGTNEDGSWGIWAIKYAILYGTLLRKKYDKDDLTKYNPKTARKWGSPNVGTPDYLLEIAKENRIKLGSQIRSYEEARDALANGYAVTAASTIGFEGRRNSNGQILRDKDGFAKIGGSWPHQMSILGVDDSYNRPGLLFMNSWPKGWITGELREQPEGSFWVSPEEANLIFKQGDSFAVGDRDGWEPKKINLRIV